MFQLNQNGDVQTRYTQDFSGTPQDMIQLDSSLHSFDPSTFGTIRDLLDKGQAKPRDALMFACSDQGCAPDNVSFAEPDRFCILQHIGSSIPSTQQCAEIEELNVDSITQLFNNFPVRHIVVCGHLDCDVIPNWLNSSAEMPDYGKFRGRFFDQTVQLVDHAYPEISSDT